MCARVCSQMGLSEMLDNKLFFKLSFYSELTCAYDVISLHWTCVGIKVSSRALNGCAFILFFFFYI